MYLLLTLLNLRDSFQKAESSGPKLLSFITSIQQIYWLINFWNKGEEGESQSWSLMFPSLPSGSCVRRNFSQFWLLQSLSSKCLISLKCELEEISIFNTDILILQKPKVQSPNIPLLIWGSLLLWKYNQVVEIMTSLNSASENTGTHIYFIFL